MVKTYPRTQNGFPPTCIHAAEKSRLADQAHEVARDSQGHEAEGQHRENQHSSGHAPGVVVGHSHLDDESKLARYFGLTVMGRIPSEKVLG